MRCSNLPDQLSTFIGREREIATATRLLHGTRLLTLTGSGGSGKTRLALAVAEKLVRRYQDGVWFIDLASITDPDLAPQAVATVLNLGEAPGRPLIQTLAAHLRTKRVLLLLDNCEHMVAACAQLAYALLTAAPGLRVLATSREPLHVTGETIWPVPPLARPEPGAFLQVEELARLESIRLFVERAGRITPGFTLNEQNALPISQICYRLGGSPLAIELAAARTRLLSPVQIAARLGNALSLLATDDRNVPSRHRTLQATLDWSYSLLSQSEQSLFRCLSVFAGSFSVEAAEAVCDPTACHQDANPPAGSERDAEDRPPHSVLDLLAELVDKSLLEVEPEARPERRYRYLAPVRLYALAKLEGSGEAACARDRLLRWAVTLAEKEGADTYRGPAWPSVEQLEIEHPNLRAALEWGQAQSGRAEERHRLAGALTQFWQNRGYVCEGLAWFEPLLTGLGEVPVPLQVSTLHSAGFLAVHARELTRARRYLEQGLALAHALEDRHHGSRLYMLLSWVALNEGKFDEADGQCDRALALGKQSGDLWGQSAALFTRANVAYLRGDYGRARESLEESMAICRNIGYLPAFARRQVHLGLVSHVEGNDERAERLIADSLRISRETRDNWGIAMAVAAKAGLERHHGQPEAAAWLLGVTRHYLDAFGVPLWVVDQIEYDRNVAELKSLLGEQALQAAMDRGAREAARDLDAVLRAVLDEPERGDTVERAPARERSISPSAPGEFATLTRREREVASLIAQGKSNVEIAETLFVGLRTVEAHVTHILNKLGFSSRTQIAAWIATKSTAEPSSVSPDLPRPRRSKR